MYIANYSFGDSTSKSDLVWTKNIMFYELKYALVTIRSRNLKKSIVTRCIVNVCL